MTLSELVDMVHFAEAGKIDFDAKVILLLLKVVFQRQMKKNALKKFVQIANILLLLVLVQQQVVFKHCVILLSSQIGWRVFMHHQNILKP